MAKIETNDTFHLNVDVFQQKAERVISVIKSINCQGAIATQLMMAEASIEVQDFFIYLEMLTHSEKDIIRNFPLNCSEL